MYNPTNMSDELFATCIEDDFDLEFKSSGKKCVVYDGTATILYEGDAEHCFIYAKWYRKCEGFWPVISTEECYNDLVSLWKKVGNKPVDLCIKPEDTCYSENDK